MQWLPNQDINQSTSHTPTQLRVGNSSQSLNKKLNYKNFSGTDFLIHLFVNKHFVKISFLFYLKPCSEKREDLLLGSMARENSDYETIYVI